MRRTALLASVKRHRLALSLVGTAAMCAVVLPACGGGTDSASKGVAFSAAPTEVFAGQTAQFTAHVLDGDGNEVDDALFYQVPTEFAAYATIDEHTGLLTATTSLTAASVQIEVDAFDDDDDALDGIATPVTIKSRVQSINVTPPSLTVPVGQHSTLMATPVIVTGSPATPAPVITWHSSSAAVTVDANGLLTPVSATPNGTPATITATSEGVTSNAVSITVTGTAGTPTAMSIGVSSTPATGSVPVGSTRQFGIIVTDQNEAVLPISAAVWSITAGATVASINSTTGLATCNAAGSATVHAVGPNNGAGTALTADATLVCVSTSTNAAAAIVLNPWTVTTTVNGTATVTASFVDATGAPTTNANGCVLGFAIDASSIASNNASTPTTVVTGVSAGVSTIRAFCNTGPNNLAAAGRVQVTSPPLNVAQISLAVPYNYFPVSTQATTYQFVATAVTGTGAAVPTAPIVWTISSGSAATIDQTGKVTVPASTGSTFGGGAVVTATSGGQTATGYISYGNTGAISGRVTSTLGQFLGSATVRVTPTGGTTITANVDANGQFYFPGLAAGTYTVVVNGTSPGQTQQTFQNITVTAGQVSTLLLTPWP